MFFVLHRREKKLFNFRVEGCQPSFLLNIGEVDVGICSRRHNVEPRIEGIYPMNHAVESRHGKSRVTLILSKGVLAETMH